MMSEAFEEKLEAARGVPLAEGLPKYQHVERLGHEEVEGLLDGTVHVQEKLDGANATVAEINGELVIASRNQVVSRNESPGSGMWKALVDYVAAHKGIRYVVSNGYILRGEWLIKHSLAYNQDAYGKFYVFDVQKWEASNIPAMGKILKYDPWPDAIKNFDIYGIAVVPDLAVLDNPTLEALVPFSQGASFLGPEREGIVLKRYDFVNRFGRTQWGKIVSADFKVKNSINFGAKNHDPAEIKFAALASPAYVLKTLHKVAEEKGESPRIQHMGDVMRRVWHDVFTEELFALVNGERVKAFNFEDARKMIERQTRDVALGFYNGVPTVEVR